MKKTDISKEDARRFFDYTDGDLIWKHRPQSDFKSVGAWKDWNAKFPGKKAGSFDARGYGMFGLTVGGVKKNLSLHRAVWSWHNGPAPDEVDHKDNDTRNNRIENLREATGSQNKANRRQFRTVTSGFVGVSYESSRNRWKAGINKGAGSTVTLGRFKCETAAALAYDRAAIAEFGEFARLNFLNGKAA